MLSNDNAERERLIQRIVELSPETWAETLALVRLGLEFYEIDNSTHSICSEIRRRLEKE